MSRLRQQAYRSIPNNIGLYAIIRIPINQVTLSTTILEITSAEQILLAKTRGFGHTEEGHEGDYNSTN